MIQTIKKAWAIPELRKKIVFTALILLIFRIGNAIPVPYVDTKLLGDYLSQMSTTVLGLYDVMSGGAFASATVFALGVQPYINSSIIIQLLTIAIPPLDLLLALLAALTGQTLQGRNGDGEELDDDGASGP